MNEMNRRWADAMFTTIGGSNDVDRARFSGALTTVLQSAQWLPRSRVRRIIGVKGMRRVESTQSCQRSLARSLGAGTASRSVISGDRAARDKISASN